MATCRTLIVQSLEDLGALSPGATIDGTALETSIFALLQQRWAANCLDQAFTTQHYHQTLSLTAGTSLYTFGTGGTLVATAAPVRVTGWASVSGNFRNGGKPISHEEFAATFKDRLGATSVLAEAVAVDGAYPSKNIRVGPVPATSPGSLILDYFGIMTQFSAVTDTLAFGPGYEDFIRADLAVALYPRYARQGAQTLEALAANVANSRDIIIANNAAILGLQQAVPQQ